MDFSKQLENLARAASNSQSEPSRGGGGGASSGNDNQERYGSHRSPRGNNNRYHPYRNSHRQRNQHRHGRGGSGLTYAEEEFYLPKLVESIEEYNPEKTLPKLGKKRHIALLFLTIDDLPFEHLWRAFLNNYKDEPNSNDHTTTNVENMQQSPENENDESTDKGNKQVVFESSSLMVSVLCHAKFPDRVRSKWLQQRLLVTLPSNRHRDQRKNHHQQQQQHHGRNNAHYSQRGGIGDDDRRQNNNVRYHTRRPEWGSIEITRAMIDLLDEGLKIGSQRDKSNTKSFMDQYGERYSTTRYVATNHNDAFGNNANASSSTAAATNKSANLRSKIPTVDRFVFVSESCLPVVTLKELETTLFGPDEEIDIANSPGGIQKNQNHVQSVKVGEENSKSDINEINNEILHPHYTGAIANKTWIKAYNKANNGYARQLQWDKVKPAIPQEKIHKADQWIMLTRHTAWPIVFLVKNAVEIVQKQHNLKKDNFHSVKLALWYCFSEVKASDEIYFPTLMSLLGLFKDIDMVDATQNKEVGGGNEQIAMKRVTYCDWSENAKNPASFAMNRQQDANFLEIKRRIKLARDEGCLFARKFIPRYNDVITVKEWMHIICDTMHSP